MEYKIFRDRNGGYFEADDNGTEAGRMTFSNAGPDKLIINHTEVRPKYAGQGVGTQMVFACVEYARSNGFKIIPMCPFARNVFVKNNEIRDVLYN